MERLFPVLLLICALLSSPSRGATERDLIPDPARAALEARVTRVIDGDTLEAELDLDRSRIPGGTLALGVFERVRLLGIDAPELFTDPPEYYAREAKVCLFKMVARRRVRLELVPGNERDGYGRLLAFVYVKKGTTWALVNGELLRQGAADIRLEGVERYAEYLRSLWVEAVANRRGMWGRYPGTVTVEEILAHPLRYALEGVTVATEIRAVEARWDGVHFLCEGGFRFLIPRSRIPLFEEAGLLELLVPGEMILASGVLSWDPTGPVVELWGPSQVHRPEVSPDDEG